MTCSLSERVAKLARIGLFETFWLPTLYTTSMFVGVIFGSKLKHPWQCLTYFLPAFGAPLQSVYCVSFSYYQVPQFVEQCRRGSRGGGPRGPCPPPPHKIVLPQIVRRGSRGAKRALPPPPGGQEGLGPPPYKILDPPMQCHSVFDLYLCPFSREALSNPEYYYIM